MKKYLWVLPAAILALTLPYKFTGNALPYLVEFFDGILGAGEGVYALAVIGVQELAIIIGLMLPGLRRYAALGAVATMLGAIGTHVYLGQFDVVFAQAWIVLLSSILIFNNEKL